MEPKSLSEAIDFAQFQEEFQSQPVELRDKIPGLTRELQLRFEMRSKWKKTLRNKIEPADNFQSSTMSSSHDASDNDIDDGELLDAAEEVMEDFETESEAGKEDEDYNNDDDDEDDLCKNDELLDCVAESTGGFIDKNQAAGQLKNFAPSTSVPMLTETSGMLPSASDGEPKPELYGPNHHSILDVDKQNKENAMNMVMTEFVNSFAYKDKGTASSLPASLGAEISQVISTVGKTKIFEVNVNEHHLLAFDSPVEDMRVLCYDPGGSIPGMFLIGIPARDIGATMAIGPKSVVDEAGAVDALPGKRVGINAKHVWIFDPGGDQLGTRKGNEQKFDKDVEKHYKEVGCDVVDSKGITDLLMAPIVQSKKSVSKTMFVHLRRSDDLITRLDSSINSVAPDMRSTLAEVMVTASCKDSEVERPEIIVQTLEAELAKLQEENSILEHSQNDLQSLKVHLEGKLEEKEKEIGKLEESCKELLEKLELTEKEKEDEDKKNAKLNKKVQTLEVQLHLSKQKLKFVEPENKENVEGYMREMEAMKEEVSSMKAEILRSSTTLIQDAEETIEDLKTESELLKDENSKLVNEFGKSSAQLQSL